VSPFLYTQVVFTHTRDLQKRPTKETYIFEKRPLHPHINSKTTCVYRKGLTPKTLCIYTGRFAFIYTQHVFCVQETCVYTKGLIQKTLTQKTLIQKTLIQKTCSRDLCIYKGTHTKDPLYIHRYIHKSFFLCICIYTGRFAFIYTQHVFCVQETPPVPLRVYSSLLGGLF